METLNAIITDASLGFSDRGNFLDAWLVVRHEYGDQGFGGYVLQVSKDNRHYSKLSVAGHFIWRVLEIADVQKWDQLPGRSIRIKRENGSIIGIGHIIRDDWFVPSDDFKNIHRIGSCEDE